MKLEHNSREKFYRYPFGAVTCGEKVTLRLAVSGVGIPYAIRVVYMCDGGEEKRADMSYVFDVGDYCIYSAELEMPQDTGIVWYWFELETDGGSVYYGNNAKALGGLGEIYDKVPDTAYQITVYDKAYKTPEWFKEGIAYQIFPDRFCNGNKDGSFLYESDEIIKRDWNDEPFYKAEQFGGEYKANDFFGGNLKGITEKLPYLKELGITVIYLNPIFKAYSNHRYDTGDYETIDPMLGDETAFKELCKKAKDMGIRIILDGVFNHTGSNSRYFNKNGEYDTVGAYQSKNSPYYSWFRFMDWPDEYESWWGMKTLPQIEENSKECREYLLSGKDAIVKRWIKNGASGWRLDVVDELPDFFVEELRENVKKTDKDAVIIGEVWEDASNKLAYGERRRYFLGKELDSVMNYPMRNALADALCNRIDAEEFNERLMSLKENYPKPAYYSLLNIVSSHDVERIITLMGNAPSRNDTSKEFQSAFKLDGEMAELAKKKVKVIAGLQMTLPGVPCIYYGDEIGMQGYGDPFCRRTFNWDDAEKNPSAVNMREYYKKIIEIRKSSKAFSIGEFECVYKIGRVYGFVRIYQNEKYLVLANMGDNYERVRVDTARFDIKNLSSVIDDEVSSAEDGIHFIDIDGFKIKIFKA